MDEHFTARRFHQQQISAVWLQLQDTPEVRMAFENSYRESMCNFNFAHYVNSQCIVEPYHLLQSLRCACETASEYSRDMFAETKDSKYLELSHYIWNPISKQLFEQNMELGLKHRSPVSTPRSSPGVPVSRTAQHPVVHSTPRTKKKKSKSHKHVALKMARVVSNRSNTPHDNVDISTLHRTLSDYSDSQPIFYPMHNGCRKRGCTQCKTLFRTAPLSRCSEHGGAVCHRIGWYPHVPGSVWSKMFYSHKIGKELTWSPELLPGQRPNIQAVQAQEPSTNCSAESTCPTNPAEFGLSTQNWADMGEPTSPPSDVEEWCKALRPPTKRGRTTSH